MSYARGGGRLDRLRGLSRIGLTGVIIASGAVLVGCVPEPGEVPPPQSSSTPSGSPVTSAPAPASTPTGSASSTFTPADGEVLIITAEVVEGALEVSAMIPNVSESNGICTLEILGTGESSEAPGSAGNGVTYCGLMSVSASSDPNSWQFQVRYMSPETQAASQPSTAGVTR